jgi:hypothetical protein
MQAYIAYEQHHLIPCHPQTRQLWAGRPRRESLDGQRGFVPSFVALAATLLIAQKFREVVAELYPHKT